MQRSENNIGENQKTSVKVHHAPGGQSNFSLGWDETSNSNTNNYPKKTQHSQLQSNISFGDYQEKVKSSEGNIGETANTSVKVHHAPGGQSNFSLSHGDDNKNVGTLRNPQPQQQGGYQQSQPSFHGGINQSNNQSVPSDGNSFKPSVRVHNPPGGRSNFTLG